MKIAYSRKFEKEYNKCPTNIKDAFKDRMQLFIENQFHPLLNNHVLVGKYEGWHSINVTGDWRVLYKFVAERDIIIFSKLGTHSQLYK